MVRLVMVVLLSCCSFIAQAAQNMDAYRIETQVEDQSEAQRTAAVKSGLEDVMVRVAGEAAAQHPLVRQAIGNASDYLLQFSYSADRDKSTSDEGVKLILSYSAQAIESLLRQAQLPLAAANSVNDAKTLTVKVDGVENFTAFKQVRAYLETITMIRRSELLSVNKNLLMFRLTLEGDFELLKSILATDNRLQLVESTVEELPAASGQLAFRWQQ